MVRQKLKAVLSKAMFAIATLAALAFFGVADAPAATVTPTYKISISRISQDPTAPTFSGSGIIRFGGLAPGIGDISFLSLDIFTLGTLSDGIDLMPAVHHFNYGLGDILDVMDLIAEGRSLTGILQFGLMAASKTGAVTIGCAGFGGLLIDFTAGVADGFCFSSLVAAAECIRGGGTSAGIEARVATAIVAFPNSLPLLCIAVLALGYMARRRRGGSTMRSLA